MANRRQVGRSEAEGTSTPDPKCRTTETIDLSRQQRKRSVISPHTRRSCDVGLRGIHQTA